jgi:hypothetical protein
LVNPRRQGDLGEASAIEWLTRWGARVWVPLFHSPDYDLLAERDGRFQRVQVKTCTYFLQRSRRWHVMVCTKGGNQSWNGLVKRLDRSRFEWLFVLVGDGRRWFIPSTELPDAATRVCLGGPKYAAFEVERGAPLPLGTVVRDASTIEAS